MDLNCICGAVSYDPTTRIDRATDTWGAVEKSLLFWPVLALSERATICFAILRSSCGI